MKKRLIIFIIAILTISLLSACSMADRTAEFVGTDEYGSTANYEPAYDYEKGGEAYLEMEDSVGSGVQYLTTSESTINNQQKIIKNGSATMEVTDYASAFSDLEALISDSGYIQNSNIWKTPRYIDGEKIMLTNANLTIRLEASRFGGFFNDLASIGLVVNQITGKDDISYMYYDTEARIELKEDEKTRLEQYLTEVDDANVYFDIQSRITEVLYEIEQLKGNILRWDDQVEYSTIQLTITEIGPDDESTLVEPKGFFGSIWENLVDGVSFLGDAIIFLAGAIPALLLLAAGVILIVKLANRKKKKKE